MKKSSLRLIVFFLAIIIANNIHAQKVAGFYPDWVSANQINNLQYDKLTDIYYAFSYPDANGNLQPTTANGFTQKLAPLVQQASQHGVKVHVSAGGANQLHSGAFRNVLNNATGRANFVNSVANLVQTYNLDGFNMDWEFPAASDAVYLGQTMQDIRTRFNTLEVTMGKELELSAAVAPLLWNTGGINQTFINACDFILIMAFDAEGNCCVCSGSQHSSYNTALWSLMKWTTGLPNPPANCGGDRSGMNAPASKLVLSIPFYTKTGGYRGYNEFSSSNPSAYYNSQNGDFNGVHYNSKPMIDAKVELIMSQYGGAGVWAWELTQDRTDQYSLLGAMWNAMQPYMQQCTVPEPNLGSDKSICGQSSVTLNSGVSTASGRTFRWYRNNVAQGAASGTATTFNATSAGVYKVEVSDGTCTESDEVTVLSTIPSVNLGDPKELCNPATVLLDANIEGPYTYQWRKDGNIIEGVTSKTYQVNEAGTYQVTVSATSCTSQSGSIVVTSSLVNAQGDVICGTGTASLSVLDQGENYAWYSQQSGGNSLHEGRNFYPQVSQTTTYYVERQNTSQSNVVGKSATSGGWQGDVSHYAQKFTLESASTISSLAFQTAAAGNVTIQILASNGTTVVASQTVAASTGFQTASVSLALEAGTYFIRASAAPAGTLFLETSGMANDHVVAGVVRLFKEVFTSWSSPSYSAVSGSDYYGFFFNITFVSGSGQACVRTPVTAVVETCTGLNTSANESIRAFPNPFDGEINLSVTSSMLGGSYELINSVGQVVDNGAISNQQQRLNTNHLPAGVYMIRMHHAEGTSLLKIVKSGK